MLFKKLLLILEMTVSSLLNLKIDNRCDLYYGKYKYRAKFHLTGLNRTYYAKTYKQFLKRLETAVSETDTWHDSSYRARLQKEINLIDLDTIEKYYTWVTEHKKQKVSQIRIEGNSCSVFSDDLESLKIIQTIDPTMIITYTAVDVNIPKGTKYFVSKPAHKYRVYFKSKSVGEAWRTEVCDFVKRYENSTTVIVPSNSFNEWLSAKLNWKFRYCSASYFLDYDDESSFTLISLLFGNMIRAQFKLEQRPI